MKRIFRRGKAAGVKLKDAQVDMDAYILEQKARPYKLPPKETTYKGKDGEMKPLGRVKK